jgi:predicted DNA-binding transcriptional regulator YafY
MAKDTYLARYKYIISRLEKGPATYEQLRDYLRRASEIDGREFSFSIRTLQRDIKDIYTHLNIEIVNDRRGDRRYRIVDRQDDSGFGSRILDTYQILQAINASHAFQDVVFLEARQPRGLEHFHSLLHAIRNKRITGFCHQKYSETATTNRIVHPLALKEALGRWYLIAVDTKDKKLKTFGLDRMSDLVVESYAYQEKYTLNLREKYRHSFGILTGDDLREQRILLRFDREQGQYVRTYPLHQSQFILEENEKHVWVELTMFITYDLVKELLSYGAGLLIEEPVSLRNRMRQILQHALNQYQ